MLVTDGILTYHGAAIADTIQAILIASDVLVSITVILNLIAIAKGKI